MAKQRAFRTRMQERQDVSLESLDKLIASLGGADTGTQSGGPYGLLVEHLQAARRDLLGSILGEYRLSLQQTKESVAGIVDKSARNTVKEALQDRSATTDRISSLDRAAQSVA